jgi:hypothetical protein
MACCLVILSKPIISLLAPLLKRIPFFASQFKTTPSNAYKPNDRYGSWKIGSSRFDDSGGWSRAGDETLVTIGGGGAGGRKTAGLGQQVGGKRGDLTSDGASDESILGYVKREKGFVVDGGGGVPGRKGGLEEGDGHELHGYKNGIVRTVAVDVSVSGR